MSQRASDLDRFLWSGWGQGPVEGSCEHGNEPSGSIKCWEVLEQLHNWRVLKKGSALWSLLVSPLLSVASRRSMEHPQNSTIAHPFLANFVNFFFHVCHLLEPSSQLSLRLFSVAGFHFSVSLCIHSCPFVAYVPPACISFFNSQRIVLSYFVSRLLVNDDKGIESAKNVSEVFNL
jgi:hypothetical protein